ncbi:PREDICTED: EGF-like repeat and discoidin I-like domain-containing protein 3 isoform X2 [Acropora digitifera]|uniref:EGF-like repeat and discoidin I-like domain-containing protein 3 isoform X2 n=1 Tax=Acropora digitifera TaxID=70779 RepID=UPI00077A7677|nr:PREDICTED: EGF-like repeat and discoidin I-like domain-containing protein 3 isoform X2 [Acropora digitifera]
MRMHPMLTVLFICVGFGTCVTLIQQQAMIKRSEFQSVSSGIFKAFFNHSLRAFLVLAEISSPGNVECALACLRNETCLSFNFAIVPHPISKLYTCQLLPIDKYWNLDLFALSQQFHHYAIPSPCEGLPCKSSNERCRPLYDKNDYECVGCNRALGMESNEILDKQITASSEFDANHAAHQGRLNFQEVDNGSERKAGSWAALVIDQHQWLQVELPKEESLVTSVATQGRNKHPGWLDGNHNQWVTKYKLQYSNNGVNFEYYQDEGQNTTKVFTGNFDRNSIVRHNLNPPIRARYIRFQPIAWSGHISMRVELYGC